MKISFIFTIVEQNSSGGCRVYEDVALTRITNPIGGVVRRGQQAGYLRKIVIVEGHNRLHFSNTKQGYFSCLSIQKSTHTL